MSVIRFKCLHCNTYMEAIDDQHYLFECNCGWITILTKKGREHPIDGIPEDLVLVPTDPLNRDSPDRVCYPMIYFKFDNFSLEYLPPYLRPTIMRLFKNETLTRQDRQNISQFRLQNRKANFQDRATTLYARARFIEYLERYYTKKPELKNNGQM